MSNAPRDARPAKIRLLRLSLAFSVLLLLGGIAVAWLCAMRADRELRDRLGTWMTAWVPLADQGDAVGGSGLAPCGGATGCHLALR